MFKIIGKQNLTTTVRRLDILAEDLVARLKPGQFVALALDQHARLVPFNVFDIDRRRKCFSVIIEEKDEATRRLGALRINDQVALVNGPFGVPVHVEKASGAVVFVAEGLGLASIVMLCRSFKQVGAKVIAIAGFESRRSSILENQMRLNCSKFHVMYKDGMHERRGDVLDPLRKVLKEESVSRVFVDAPIGTVEAVSRIAFEANVPVLFNMMELLALRPSFNPSGYVLFGQDRYFPAVDGVVVPCEKASPAALYREMDALKEYSECRRKEAELSRRSGVLARLKKFIWG